METRGRAGGARWVLCCTVGLGVFTAALGLRAGPGEVKAYQKISAAEGGFTGVLDDHDEFGQSTTTLGDLNGDGVQDLAVGAPYDDDGGPNRGAVWLLFLRADGTVKAHQKISARAGAFTGALKDHEYFGQGISAVGDIDADGVEDLGVGAPYDSDGGPNRGAVWTLFLRADGTVKAHQKISSTEGGFTGVLEDGDQFGLGLGSLGDLDGDGTVDLAVGAPFDKDGGSESGRGAIWILFLHPDGRVKGQQKISSTAGGFTGILGDGGRFGHSIAPLGDLDGDGVEDLAVGAPRDYDVDFRAGAVWILFLHIDGTVKAHQKINSEEGGFTGILGSFDSFGSGLARLGDLDDDGIEDLAVGAPFDFEARLAIGAVWILFLHANGTVKTHQKISATRGSFSGIRYQRDMFGSGIAFLGDLDRDGVGDLAVGAPSDADGCGEPCGAVWVLFLDSPSSPWSFIRGDTNADGEIDIGDAIVLLLHLFRGLDLICESAGNANGNTPEAGAELDLSDVIYLLMYKFGRGPPLPPPFPFCGQAPLPSNLTCAHEAVCAG